jgi:hypothetical protein
MKTHIIPCRGGAFVRAVILCLLAIFCLSLVAVPVKAGPPRRFPYYDLAQRTKADTDGDPWVVDGHAAPVAKGECGNSLRQITRLLVSPTNWALGAILVVTDESKACSTVERGASDYDSRR